MKRPGGRQSKKFSPLSVRAVSINDPCLGRLVVAWAFDEVNAAASGARERKAHCYVAGSGPPD